MAQLPIIELEWNANFIQLLRPVKGLKKQLKSKHYDSLPTNRELMVTLGYPWKEVESIPSGAKPIEVLTPIEVCYG